MAENGPEIGESVLAQEDEVEALKKFHGAKYDSQVSKIAEKTALPLISDPELKEAAAEEGLSDDLNTLDIIHKAEMQKFIDPLTKLPNRRGFELATKMVYKQLEKYPDGKAYILFLDLDHFKKVNDEYGHETGDEVLVSVAEHLSNDLREQDGLGRLGGEEFAVILLDKGPTFENQHAERLNPIVTANRLLVDIRKAVASKTRIKKQGVSIGLAEIERDPSTGQFIPVEEVLRRADVAAYHAKKNGRGRVIVHQPGMAMPPPTIRKTA